ncbi:MAG TPA: VCBS repeat-containing protein, partial [Flavobacteriales bacterium]|nr:VCBS repeat-containing protein [Flavobacteriales bacterium]
MPEFSGQTVDLYTGDFDGNGVDDILAAVVGYAIDGTVKVCYGFKVYITGSSGPPFTYAFPPSSVFTIMHGRKQSSFACPDIDGDGRDDILLSGVIYNDIVEKWQATGIHAFISQSHGSVVDFDHQVFAGPPNPYTFYMPEKFDRGQVRDFDGDGRFDFAFFGTDNNWNVLRGYLWTYADGWVLLPALSYGSAFSQAERISVIDINGDGQTEVHLRFEAPIRSMIMRLNPSSTDWEM